VGEHHEVGTHHLVDVLAHVTQRRHVRGVGVVVDGVGAEDAVDEGVGVGAAGPVRLQADGAAGRNVGGATSVTGRPRPRLSIYQTRQAAGRTIGCPALQEKARWNSGMFETTPSAR